MDNDRPLIFVDLDDTLFQTARKMPQGTPRTVATLDVQGQANGYMTPVQASFIRWLLASADVVPVTARSVEAYSRVQLPFTQGAICSHGGVMLCPNGRLDQDWHSQMSATLEPYQQRLPDLSKCLLQIGATLGHSLRSWVVEEQELDYYVVAKHNGAQEATLTEVLTELQSQKLLDAMHIHQNGNNLALLPQGLSKGLAVQEWLRRDLEIQGARPILGLGDSITDLGFMDLCHLWATPAQSQLAQAVKELLND